MSRKLLAARSNWAFFTCAVASELMRDALKSRIVEAQQGPRSFIFGYEGYDGYMIIDASELDLDVLQDDLPRAIEDVADNIHRSVHGDLSDRVVIESGEYRFSFRISDYWIGTPYDPPIVDPIQVCFGGKVGRTVKLEVGYRV